MKRQLATIAVILITLSVSANDIGNFQLYASGKNVDLYVEPKDDREYELLLQIMDERYELVAKHLNPNYSRRINLYVYCTQKSLWKNYFKTQTMKIKTRGFGDANNARVLLTSIYEDCYPDELRYKVPIHEMVHVIYPHRTVWIREGIANYDPDNLSKRLSDLQFYVSEEETSKAYNFSGWMVRYIVDELSGGDYEQLLLFASDSQNYLLLGFEDEISFFEQWNQYMIQQNRSTKQTGKDVY